jgi:ribosomal protein S27E
MNAKCPFCWDRNTVRIAAGRIIACEDCERWYWADSGQEIARLCEICATPLIEPQRCFEDVRELLSSGGTAFPRQRTAEFNRLCSLCPNGRFGAGPAHAQA